MSSDQGWFESDEDFRSRVAKEADERTIEQYTGDSPSQGWFESDEGYRERIANEANERRIESSTGDAPSQGWFEGDDSYRDRIAREANERSIESSTGSSPSQGWFESEETYDIRVRKEANEQIIKNGTGSSPEQGWFESDHVYRSRIALEARLIRADNGGFQGNTYSSFQVNTYSSSGGSGGATGILILIVAVVALWLGYQRNNESLSKTAPTTTNNTAQAQSRKSPEYSGETGVVNTPGDGFLALRSEPTTNQGSRLLKIPHATPLDIGGCVSNSKAEHWCRTTYQGQNGWIMDRYIIKDDKTNKNISAAEAITLPRGNADRKAILDVIRVDYSRPVIFEVLHLKNSGVWTWATVRPKSADGKEDYEDQSVLLQRIGNKWQKVDGLDHGADCGEEYCPETDIAALQRRHANAPASIFE